MSRFKADLATSIATQCSHTEQEKDLVAAFCREV